MTQKRIRLAVAGLVVLAAILGAGGWFWSLGAVASEDIQKARVELVKEPVEWRRQNDADWKPLTSALELLPGDRIRTGDTGEASLRWGDAGITRIESGTEIEIEQVAVGSHEPLIIRMRLESGRVWSRLLKVLDVEGGVSVETSDIVATVRGTSFGIGKAQAGTEAAVTESVIGIRDRFLKEGQWGLFNASSTVTVRDLGPNDLWAVRNREADREFDHAFLRELEQRFAHTTEGREGVPTWLLQTSERLRLAFVQGDKAEDLASRYAMRHAALSLVKKGGSESDEAAVVSFGERAGSRAILVARDLHALAALDAAESYAIGMSANTVRIVSLRDLRDQLLAQTDDGALVAAAVGLNESIDEVVFGPLHTEESEGALLAELAGLSGDLPSADSGPELRSELAERIDAMGYRLGFDGGASAPLDDLPIDPEIPTSIQPGVRTDSPQLQPSVIKPTEPDRPYQRLVLYANPAQAAIGTPVRLTLYGVKADGTTENLNAQSAFSATAQGSFAGNIFTPATAGTITLSAAYTDTLGTRTASTQITVNSGQAPTTGLRSIRFAFQTDTTMTCSSQLPFRVLATYGDGTTKDVTISIKTSVSNNQLISVQGDKVLSYCAGQTSTAQVSASYTETGQTVQTSATITVVPDPQSGGGQRPPGYRYP